MTDGYKIKRVLIRPNGTEKQVYPAGWKPGANTVGYYPLNGDDNDYSGNNRNLTVAFGTPSYTTLSSGIKVASPRATGQNAGGFGFYNSDAVWNFSSDFTVSFWGKILNAVWDYGSFVSDRYTGDDYRWMCSFDSNRQFFFHGSAQYLSGYTIPLDTWQHICCTVISNTYYIYVNGVLKKSGSYSYSSSTPSILRICYGYHGTRGEWNGYELERLNGDLSNIIIENKGWTVTEVTNYYNQTKSTYGL